MIRTKKGRALGQNQSDGCDDHFWKAWNCPACLSSHRIRTLAAQACDDVIPLTRREARELAESILEFLERHDKDLTVSS